MVIYKPKIKRLYDAHQRLNFGLINLEEFEKEMADIDYEDL